MMRIGEFAMTSGLTVKALRHYDALGLLKPTATEASGYRNYMTDQLRSAATIRALRDIGIPLDDIAQALEHPDRIDAMTAERIATVAREREREDAALQQGRAMIAALGDTYTVRERDCREQPWVGLARSISDVEDDEDTVDFNADFAAVWAALRDAGMAPSGAWWTTLRSTPGIGMVEAVCCWPVERLPPTSLQARGATIETGVLPVRRELYVSLPQSHDEPDSGQGQAAHIALLEHATSLRLSLIHASVRQIGVLDEGGSPVAIELALAIR
jgi:DNA-binding transcriptional MerR regulator